MTILVLVLRSANFGWDAICTHAILLQNLEMLATSYLAQPLADSPMWCMSACVNNDLCTLHRTNKSMPTQIYKWTQIWNKNHRIQKLETLYCSFWRTTLKKIFKVSFQCETAESEFINRFYTIGHDPRDEWRYFVGAQQHIHYHKSVHWGGAVV